MSDKDEAYAYLEAGFDAYDKDGGRAVLMLMIEHVAKAQRAKGLLEGLTLVCGEEDRERAPGLGVRGLAPVNEVWVRLDGHPCLHIACELMNRIRLLVGKGKR